MKLFGFVVLFLIAFLASLAIIALIHIRRSFIRIRQHLTGDYDDETVKRMSEKYYRGDGNDHQFDENYFKGSGSRKSYRPNSRSQQQARQTTTTKEGVTIIDGRSNQDRHKKIFSDNEGEYVEFTEE